MNSCKNCNQPTNNPSFCSKSCSAQYNNRGVNRHGTKRKECLNCNTVLNDYRSVYCNSSCHNEHRNKKLEEKILNNEIVNWKHIRRYLIKNTSKCFVCGIKDWNDLPISLECDHIDGDITNNRFSNARLLCPNCHSQTETFRSKNKNNPKGKEARRERYNKSVNGASGGTRTPIFNSDYD